jgi:hypothetical protein
MRDKGEPFSLIAISDIELEIKRNCIKYNPYYWVIKSRSIDVGGYVPHIRVVRKLSKC